MSGGIDSFIEDGHSIFRPSYSATWLNCEDALVSGLSGRDFGGQDAAVGTVFHALMAQWRTTGVRPINRLGKVVYIHNIEQDEEFRVEIDEDMFSFGDECIRRLDELDGDFYYERRVDISDLTPIPDQGGTADVINCKPKLLRIIDYKYGTGVKVYAHKNTQLLLYAWGSFKEFDWIYGFEDIECWIYQPRLGHFECFKITRDELLMWAGWARARAFAAWKPAGRVRTPSPKACQWCRVRADCAALELAREEMVREEFEGLVTYTPTTQLKPRFELPDRMRLSTPQLAHIYAYRKTMDRWFKGISEELIRRGMEGEQIPGWRTVNGRTHRKWKDDEEVAEIMREKGIPEDEIYPPKIVTPNAAGKLFRAVGFRGKALESVIDEMTYHPEGKPTLVPIDDNRDSIPDFGDELEIEGFGDATDEI